MARKKRKTAAHQQGTPEQRPPLPLPDRLFLYLTVTITGAAVMMIELLGTRIIGPFYGVSLIVWSSLLSVALLALSIGYYAGGRLADSVPWLRVSHIVLAAAVLIGLIPLISEPVQLAANALGLRLGALVSAFVLFTLPLMCLGMVGPFVIKIATSRLDVVGSSAGSVYAVSTLGSVFGTLILGFSLLPLFGTLSIILVLSLVLVGLSLGLAVYENKRLKADNSPALWATASTVVGAALLFGLAGTTDQRQYDNYQVLFEEETHYGWVRVVDQPEKDIRWLMSDASTIGAEYLPHGTSLLSYQRVVQQVPWFEPQAEDALLIGLGAGHLVNQFSRHGIKTDAIEIDPAVAEAAAKHFSFEPSGRVIVGDARYQIKQLDKRYDIIVHDCFTGGAEPIHLLSREMITELRGLLKPGGVLALNFVGFNVEEDNKPVESVAHTLDAVFPHRRTFVASPDAKFNDFVFLVSDQPIEQPTGSDEARRAANWMSQHEVQISGNEGVLITDNYNPLEYLQVAKAEYYRNLLIERVGKDILFR